MADKLLSPLKHSGPDIPPLTALNYKLWAYDVKMGLKRCGAWGFISGDEIPPAETEKEDVKRNYRLRKDQVLGFICSYVGNNYKHIVRDLEDPLTVWNDLKAIFEPTTRARKCELRDQLGRIKMEEGEDMAIYLSRIDSIVAQLKDMKVNIDDEELSYRYHRDLPTDYESLVSQIYNWKTDDYKPQTVRQYLIAEQGRRRCRETNTGTLMSAPTPAGFVTSTPQFVKRCFNCGSEKHFARECPHPRLDGKPRQQQQQQQQQVVNTRGKRGRGHRRGGGRGRGQGRGSQQPQASAPVSTLYVNDGAFFVTAPSDVDLSPIIVNNDVLTVNSASLIDPKLEWLIDSGCTDHMCCDRSLFSNLQQITPFSVQLAEGKSQITAMGSVNLTGLVLDGQKTTLKLNKVYYAPSFVRNLLSLARIDEAGCDIRTKDGLMSIYNSNVKVPLCEANKCGGLYKLRQFRGDLTNSVQSDDSIQNSINVAKSYANTVKEGTPVPQSPPKPKPNPKPNGLNGSSDTKASLSLWHKRLGHQHLDGVIRLSKSRDVFGVRLSGNERSKCESCAQAKSTRASCKPIGYIQSTRQLELLHMDVWGPSREPSSGGARYYLSIVDDYSRYTFIYPMKTKDEVLKHFKVFINLMYNRYGDRIITIRTDNGMEFCSKAFTELLQSYGIAHQRTNTYTPQMNGVAERINRTLVEGVRAIMIETQLPKAMWGELVLTMAYLKNRFPHRTLKFKTPYALWHEKRVSLRHLRRIGSKAFVHKTDAKGDKLESIAWEGVVVGYAYSTLGLRIWDPKTGRVVETKHVDVFEDRLWGSGAAPIIMEQPVVKRTVDDTFELIDSIYSPGLSQTGGIITTSTVPIPSIGGTLTSLPSTSTSLPGPIPTPITKPLSIPTTESIRKTAGLPHSGQNETFLKGVHEGWRRVEIPRKTGERVDVYFYPPDNTRLRSKTEVLAYCRDEEIRFEAAQFDFQPKTTHPRARPAVHVNLCSVIEPSTFKEAMQLPERDSWKSSMDDEIETFVKRGVYEEVQKPTKARVLGGKWIYKLKKDADGNVKRYRSRLVAQGFRQALGVDYDDVFSPVVNYVVIRFFFLLLVVLSGWSDTHLDVKCAYLYGDLHETIYMRIPDGYATKGKHDTVWLLKKSLYGLHQSGRMWHQKLNEELMKIGFESVIGVNCVYTFGPNVVLLVYVDDLVLFTKTDADKQSVFNLLTGCFDIVDLGPVTMLLGVAFERNGTNFFMHQAHYITKIAEKFKSAMQCFVTVPVASGTTVVKPLDGEEELDFPYRSLIGSLLFLATRSRPDILFSVIQLSQFNNCHSKKHVQLLLQVLEYVVSTKDFYIDLYSCTSDKMYAYSDASWATNLADRRSFSGYIIYLGGTPISWGCSKQKCVAQSSMESEYLALAPCVKEAKWLSDIFANCHVLGGKYRKPLVFTDSTSAESFTKNCVENVRSRHIDVRYHFLRDWFNNKLYDLEYVKGDLNVADLLTKWLPGTRLYFLCSSIYSNIDSQL